MEQLNRFRNVTFDYRKIANISLLHIKLYYLHEIKMIDDFILKINEINFTGKYFIFIFSLMKLNVLPNVAFLFRNKTVSVFQ